MSRITKINLILAAAALLAVVLGAQGERFDHWRSWSGARPTANTKTVWVGRFLIDLPQAAVSFNVIADDDREMMGTETDVLAPFLHLEMKTGSNPNAGGKPLQSSLSQSAVLALWDQISSSIRLRPAALQTP